MQAETQQQLIQHAQMFVCHQTISAEELLDEDFSVAETGAAEAAVLDSYNSYDVELYTQQPEGSELATPERFTLRGSVVGLTVVQTALSYDASPRSSPRSRPRP